MTRNDDSNATAPKAAESTTAAKDAKNEAAKDTNNNTGARSALDQAVGPEVSSDALNPAFASPEVQEQIAKDWQEGAEHTVDAEKVLKEQENKK